MFTTTTTRLDNNPDTIHRLYEGQVESNTQSASSARGGTYQSLIYFQIRVRVLSKYHIYTGSLYQTNITRLFDFLNIIKSRLIFLFNIG